MAKNNDLLSKKKKKVMGDYTIVTKLWTIGGRIPFIGLLYLNAFLSQQRLQIIDSLKFNTFIKCARLQRNVLSNSSENNSIQFTSLHFAM